MLAIELDPDIEKRLELLAERTGHTKDFHAREAIREHLADLEDIYLATERLAQPAPIYSSDEVKRGNLQTREAKSTGSNYLVE